MTRVQDSSGTWYAQITKSDGETLDFRLDKQPPAFKHQISFGIRDLLRGESRQFIAKFAGGGPECHSCYWMVDISDQARTVFDGTRYRLRPLQSVEDLDGNGTSELVFRAERRAAVAGPLSEQPAPVAIFSYSEDARRFIPANHLFRKHALADLRALTRKVLRLRDSSAREGDVLEAALTLMYAGWETEARTFLRRHGRHTSWAEFEELLTSDRFYQDLVYQPGFRALR